MNAPPVVEEEQRVKNLSFFYDLAFLLLISPTVLRLYGSFQSIKYHMSKCGVQNFLGSKEAKNAREKHQNKLDSYDFGVMLLEIISGKPICSSNEVEFLKKQFQASIIVDDTSRNSIVYPAIKNLCSGESLKTMMELCCRCLIKDPADRPSIEDVLWNLQFASQIQDAWRGDSQSSKSSPTPPLKSARLKRSIK